MQRSMTFKQQKGVVLFVALIALVVLMIAAVALIRSTDTAQMIAGNLAVKRDLTHESERAVQAALANFDTSAALGLEAARWANVSSANYYATALASNSLGIPTMLLSQATTGEASAANPGVTYAYIIDRMCPATGSPDLPTAYCISGGTTANTFINSMSASANAGGGLPKNRGSVVYRITVRLTDARQTQSFFQTTLSSIGN